MICRECGEVLNENARVCSVCGAVQTPRSESATLNPSHSYSDDCAHDGHVVGSTAITFLDAVKLYVQRWLEFKGRSRRSEYWWATLGVTLVSFALGLVNSEISSIWTVLTLIPSLSLSIRRLHDIGKSGWNYLLGLIPIAGPVLLIVWFCRDSDGANQWGQNPKD